MLVVKISSSVYGRHLGFQNGRHFKSNLAYISGTNTRRDMILVSRPMFWGSRNSVRPIITLSDLAFQNGHQKFKMAARFGLFSE